MSALAGNSLRELLELAVIADLKAKLAYVADVRPYEGQLGSGQLEDLDDVRRSLNGVNPGVLVGTGEGRFTVINLQRRRYTRELDLQLTLVTRSMRSRSAQRHGDAGMYRLLEDVAKRLVGWDAGVAGVGPLRAVNERSFIQEPDLCIWLMTMTAETDFVGPDRREEGAADLTELAGTVNLPEDVGLIAQGTGDSLAVAAGVVTLIDAGMAAELGWVGLRVRLQDTEHPANEGDFAITARPSATQIQFANAAAMPETSAFTWKLLAPPGPLLSVEVEQP